MQLHFQSYGRGKPLVLLHGLFGSLDNWQPVSVALGRHFQVLAVDQRNHGRSPHDRAMEYRLMAEDVRELMDAQGLAGAHLLGHSMGGKTAMQLALLHPDKVERLVVADIAPRSYAPRHQSIFTALLKLDLAAFQSRKQIEDALAPDIPALPLRQFLLKNAERTPQGAFRWRNGLSEIYQNYSHLGAAVSGPNAFDKPALFLRGQISDYLVEADLAAIQKLFPQALLETVPGAGHLIHVDNRSGFVNSVLDFLRP